jgi:type VI secretion system secreted protein Hcp
VGLFDAFLKIDGIEGESQDAKHKNEIHLESFSWSESQTGTSGHGGGAGAGKVAMQDFHLSKQVDKSSPRLMLACASGDHIKTAVVTVRKAGKDQQPFLKFTLSDVLISGYSIDGAGSGGHVPMEQVILNFSRIEKEYKEQKADGTLGGTVKVGWDVKLNKKV